MSSRPGARAPRHAARYGGVGLLVAGLLLGCRGGGTPAAAVYPRSAIRLTRVTEAAGINFRHENGETGRKWFPEWLGGGVAFFDYDRDGWQDLYFVNGGSLPGWKGTPPTGHLYRNRRDGTFTDVTHRVGLDRPHYGVGVCAGDYDGDARPDLLVTGFGGVRLYRNCPDGRFRDVAAAVGVQVAGLSSGAAFLDYDGDGNLDLYICRYVRYTLATDVPCYQARGEARKRIICRQIVYDPAPDMLFRNTGHGRFTEVTRTAGASVPPGRGLGVIPGDFDGNGHTDLYVANDLTPNFLFRSDGRRLRESAFGWGVAVNDSGQSQAGMGVATADVDGDGRLDLLVTNFAGEYTTLYLQQPDGKYRDVSASWGLVEATHKFVGFGVGLVDLDLDGRPDILSANGHVSEDAEQFYEGTGLAQAKLVLRHEGSTFRRLADPWGDARSGAEAVGRGAAFADYDNDGDVDMAVSNLRGTPDLLRNDTPPAAWLRVELEGRPPNTQAVGATVRVRAGGRRQAQAASGAGSYCSQNDLRLIFGLGGARSAETVEVIWPDGTRTERRNVPSGVLRLKAPG